MAELKIPTETVTLPSKGLLYPETSPLAKGEIEMKYMTAKEEDILTNSNYIQQGIVIDKLLQALIVTPIDYNELLIGDKNAVLVAARILGYGKDYDFKYIDKSGNERQGKVDLASLDDKELDESLITPHINSFEFELPKSKNKVTFKLLTHGDEKKIDAEIKGLIKINPQGSYDSTTRLKYMITSINGKTDEGSVREFVDKLLLAPDARALREYYTKVQPDIELKFMPEDESYTGEGMTIPITLNFFWPDAGI
jgi:hypothetical protein